LDGVLGEVTSTCTSVRFAVRGFLTLTHTPVEVVEGTYVPRAEGLSGIKGKTIALSTYAVNAILMPRRDTSFNFSFEKST
jgi:hypothetical protein